uniref:Coat protein n=1 Tax=Diaporthe helianthi partitivirus 1 TaxID=3077435 RepID=A0AA96HD73_9VIRU|nr:MAG: coat protein [Diaporthe helianthi partitivirus 1]
MADNQSRVTSTVAPSDSASASGRKKKSKPGKAERAAARSALGSQPGQQASQSKASAFAASVQTPMPNPGKFPVVFSTGAGEPSRDKNFAIDERVLAVTIRNFPARFTDNAKYAEFKAHADLDDADFSRHLSVAALLRLAQQVVHSHVNMGLPQGDFAPVASTDVRLPASMSAYISQYGEHSVPALGTRFLFADYDNTVRSLVWSAACMSREGNGSALTRSWLPVRSGDRRTKLIIASRLAKFLESADVAVTPKVLEDAVLGGDVPSAFESIKPLLGDTDVKRDRFDFLFKAYHDAPTFVTKFTETMSVLVLEELNLHWRNPSAAHVDWGFNVKEIFTQLADEWARRSSTYAQFFELSSSQVNRSASTGSQSQMALVTSTDGVTIIKTHLALSAPEFSLVACFPATCVYSGDLERRVVVTTPLSVRQRATEFVQMDWR